nr:vacuolar membrane-associated protein IML1 [Cryptococcus depauperatus CBS 7841]
MPGDHLGLSTQPWEDSANGEGSDSSRPSRSRTRSSTVGGTGLLPAGGSQPNPPTIDVVSSSFRTSFQPQTLSAAANTLSSLPGSVKRPRLRANGGGHNRISSWPSPPQTLVAPIPSTPVILTKSTIESGILDLTLLNRDRDSVALLLYTYKPSAANHLPGNGVNYSSPLLSMPSSASAPPSQVILNYAALPWDAQPGDYLEIRQINRSQPNQPTLPIQFQIVGGGKKEKTKKPPALENVKSGKGRESYVFKLGGDSPSTNIHQIQVPDSVAQAFGFQNRLEVEVRRIHNKESAHTDYVEFYFSQYLGRADMWRLGMSLEGTTLHVGEKVSLAGGAVRAEVNFIIRSEKTKSGTEMGPRKVSSGIVTAKTKTIFRSKSAQVYIFIQLCEETWQFDEDGERYVEKVVHGYLPELFARWEDKATSHVVTIIFFARILYNDEEVEYLRKHNIADVLSQDHSGQWYKDFFKVGVDLERRNDWMSSLPEIKKQLERSEREVLLDYHLNLLRQKGVVEQEIRIVGRWSFAYQGNVLEAINLALNPFDEHYVDRDLSRTGLSITVVTPGTGHFAVDKNLLRLTTERMVDHGISTDFVCLTKMPLHSVPLFSYISHKPKGPVFEQPLGVKNRAVTPDLLYFDVKPSQSEMELADCYSLPSWVSCSFYAVTHDKPFREDRFVPRCKMYDIQMLGILDHNLTAVNIPPLNVNDTPMPRRPLTMEDRKAIRNAFDQTIFTSIPDPIAKVHSSPAHSASCSIPASYQSARLVAEKAKERTSSISMSRPKSLGPPDIIKPSPVKAIPGTDEFQLGKKTVLRNPSPAPSSLSLRKRTRSTHISTEESTSSESEPPKEFLSLPTENDLESPCTMTRPASPMLASTDGDNTMSANGTHYPHHDATFSKSSSNLNTTEHGADTSGSGTSTPKGTTTPARNLKHQTSRGGFIPSWVLNSFKPLLSTSKPSFAQPSTDHASRTDVSTHVGNSRSHSPSPSVGSLRRKSVQPPNPTAIITPSTPSPSRIDSPRQRSKPGASSAIPAQPVPIAAKAARVQRQSEEDAISRSLRSKGHGLSRSYEDSSLRAQSNALVQPSRHFIINPCKPSVETINRVRDAGSRRWRFALPKLTQQHIVQWPNLVAAACLPLTTDFLPDQKQSDALYTTGTYTVQCYLEEGAFLIRSDAADASLPLAMMKEMVSQRLSLIVQPHELAEPDKPRPMPIHLEKDADIGVELVSGGASEVLKKGQGAIWLSWANHIHRLLFHPTKPEIIVHWMTRKILHQTEPVQWKGLVWPSGTSGYQKATATFNYPDVSMKINYNHLDHLINGERADFGPLRYWRTRFILIPSGRDPISFPGIMPKNENLGSNDLLWLGAQKLIETLNRYLLKRPDGQSQQRSLKIVTTTFDPSTCILDEELMMDLARQITDELAGGKKRKLEGMTLANVAELMCQPQNGLVIRTRWWESREHLSSFNGFELREWLQNTFEDVTSREKAQEWAAELVTKGLIEHVTKSHGFLDYWHFYYRLKEPYNTLYGMGKKEKEGKHKSWFSTSNKGAKETSSEASSGGKVVTAAGGDLSAATTDMGAPSQSDKSKYVAELGHSPLAKIYLKSSGSDNDDGKEKKTKLRKKKIVMTQTRILDLDPSKKSDRAEVAILHTDVVHNARNAFHLELNWLGVTAALLEELRQKLAAQADRYGLRFVETPVEQIADIPKKCAYQTPILIRLAVAPPVITDLHTRLVAVAHGTGQAENYFEYSILTKKFNFVLDVEASDRYPDHVEIIYSYRKGNDKYTYSQFSHQTGLALVQCVGGENGFLWSDNRLIVSAPTRKGVGNRTDEARALRRELEAFCSNPEALKQFYTEVTPPLPKLGTNTPENISEAIEDQLATEEIP